MSATETVRARFFGGAGPRHPYAGAWSRPARGDGSQRDDGRRVAAFAGEIELAPGAETKIAIVLGQAATRALALAAARAAEGRDGGGANSRRRAPSGPRGSAKCDVTTNRPDFDRLVNTWLPYQLYASRLFGRVGPNQRGGAIGFRDQLQDVLPLILTRAAAGAGADRAARRPAVPRRRRAEMVASRAQRRHGRRPAHQGERSASVAALCARALCQRRSGDASVLDEIAPYLEGPAVPAHEDTWIVTPRPSRESGDVYEHARRAIEYTLRRLGANGLPLLGAGDWNDGIDALGREGSGTSVWMGFFFFNVLSGFIPLARLKGDEAFAETLRRTRARPCACALESAWRGDHYALDFADDGRVDRHGQRDDDGLGRLFGRASISSARSPRSKAASRAIERPDRVLLLEKPFFEHSASPIPAASPIIRRACARTAANTATARPGSSTASCALAARGARQGRRRPGAQGSPRAPSRSSRRSRR